MAAINKAISVNNTLSAIRPDVRLKTASGNSHVVIASLVVRSKRAFITRAALTGLQEPPLFPFQYAANHDQLSQMIRIMVGYEERFPEQGLALAMRDLGGEIALRIGN